MNDFITISELTLDLKDLLESNYSHVKVMGEISNYNHHSSGHRYFTLKDSNAQISCVMWRSRHVSFKPEDGMQVTATGKITVYPPRGNYQIDVVSINQAGVGDLYIAFEKLKNELLEKGYFDQSIKKQIPQIPQRIGVSTSPTGAAVKDIFSTFQRRAPFAEIVFHPVRVQGAGTEKEIAAAIKELDKENLDLIVIGRGGGSLEDLWRYNTIEVADAIRNAKTPIISGVGHETDTTISDMVADMRAPTPTGAAELASRFTYEDIMQTLDIRQEEFNSILEKKIKYLREKLEDRAGRIKIERIKNRIEREKEIIEQQKSRLDYLISRNLNDYKEKINSLEGLYKNLHPEKPLDKGFAILFKDGNIVSKDAELKANETVTIKRKNSTNKAKIEK